MIFKKFACICTCIYTRERRRERDLCPMIRMKRYQVPQKFLPIYSSYLHLSFIPKLQFWTKGNNAAKRVELKYTSVQREDAMIWDAEVLSEIIPDLGP